MPQAIIAAISSVLVSIGVSAAVATIIATVAVTIGISFISGLFTGGGSARSEKTERSVKNATPIRTHAYGSRRLYGASMLFDTAANGSSVDVWAFHDGRANRITQVYLNDDKVTLGAGGIVQPLADGAYKDGAARAGYNLGLPTETAFSWVVDRMPGIWTVNHRGDGIVSGFLLKASVSAKHYLETYPQGDNVVMSLAGEWQLCFDPRDPSQNPLDQNTWKYTENAVLHLLHYFMIRRGYDYATRLAPVISYWIAAANHCDEPVALKAGGTEPRYRGCVAYDADKLPGDIISELLACFDGWTAQDENGCHLVYSGRVYQPTVSIGPAEIVSYSHQSFVEQEDAVNELIVQYVSALHDYSTVECQPWRDEDDISRRGRINSDGFSPQVPSHTQARRLAKRAMARRNAPNRGRVTTTLAGRAVIGQRYVRLRIEEAGTVQFDGIAEIISAERDFDTGGVTFDWIGVTTAMDAWNPTTEDGEPAPIGARVPVDPLDPPVISSAAANFAAGYARVEIAGTGPDRTDLTWFARTRVSGESAWTEAEYADTAPGVPVALITGPVASNADIEVEIAYQIGDGRVSPWSATETVDTTAP